MNVVDKNHSELQQKLKSSPALGYTMHQYRLGTSVSRLGEKVMVSNKLGSDDGCTTTAQGAEQGGARSHLDSKSSFRLPCVRS